MPVGSPGPRGLGPEFYLPAQPPWILLGKKAEQRPLSETHTETPASSRPDASHSSTASNSAGCSPGPPPASLTAPSVSSALLFSGRRHDGPGSPPHPGFFLRASTQEASTPHLDEPKSVPWPHLLSPHSRDRHWSLHLENPRTPQTKAVLNPRLPPTCAPGSPLGGTSSALGPGQVGPHLWCWQRRPLAHGHRSKAPSGSSSQVMRSRSRLAGSWQSSPSTGRGVHTGNNRPRTGRESPLRARHQAGRHQEKGQRNGVRPPPSTVNPKVEVRTEDMEW